MFYSQAKLSPAIWFTIILLAAFAVGYYAWSESLKEPNLESGIMNQGQNEAQKMLSSDQEIRNILEDFQNKPEIQVGRDEVQAKVNGLFHDSLSIRDIAGLQPRLDEARKSLEEWSNTLADAPDIRALVRSQTKLCITESIIKNDLKGTAINCGVYSEVDDLTADAQILPLLLSGFAYHSSRNSLSASTYLEKIQKHYVTLISLEYVDIQGPIFELYNKIYDKALSLYTDYTESWEIFRSEEYGFEVKFPPGLLLEAPYNGPDPTAYDFAVQISNVKNPFGIHCGESEKESGINPCSRNQAFYVFVNNEESVPPCSKQDKSCYSIQNEDRFYVLRFLAGEDVTEEAAVTFNQMVSTFKFIEPVDTSKWQTYRNEEYGFEVKYPRNWIYSYTPDFGDGKFKLLQLGFGPSQTNLPVGVFVGEGGLNGAPHYVPILGPSFKKTAESNILMGGKSGKQFVMQNIYTNDVCIVSFSTDKGEDDLTYSVSMCLQDSAIYNQILSTFRFIE